MRKPIFINDYIYHIYNRGVEKRDIFLDDKDRTRFIHDLYEFNDIKPAAKFLPANAQYSEVELPNIEKRHRRASREFLVEILAFCTMPNHFHLLLRQKKNEGIIRFMQKLGTGYTNYFNKKYERVGPLFQGRFKAVLIKKESQLLWILHYIHLNPLELNDRTWKEKGIKNVDRSLKFLYNYRWSSLLDYIGKKNFPSLTQREFLLDIFGGETGYKRDLLDNLAFCDTEGNKKLILD